MTAKHPCTVKPALDHIANVSCLTRNAVASRVTREPRVVCVKREVSGFRSRNIQIYILGASSVTCPAINDECHDGFSCVGGSVTRSFTAPERRNRRWGGGASWADHIPDLALQPIKNIVMQPQASGFAEDTPAKFVDVDTVIVRRLYCVDFNSIIAAREK